MLMHKHAILVLALLLLLLLLLGMLLSLTSIVDRGCRILLVLNDYVVYTVSIDELCRLHSAYSS